MSVSALCEASEVWRRLTAPYAPHEDPIALYSFDELLSKIKPTAGSPRAGGVMRAAPLEEAVLGKLLLRPDADVAAAPAAAAGYAAGGHRGDAEAHAKGVDGQAPGGKGMPAVPPGMHPPTGQYSEKSWLARAEERRSRFQQAKDKGFSYNKGVMLDVTICKGPQEGTIGFAAGRGHPSIPA